MGSIVGEAEVGSTVGLAVEGDWEEPLEGSTVGSFEGEDVVGFIEGEDVVGFIEGAAVVGLLVGVRVVGLEEGGMVGFVGLDDGLMVGLSVPSSTKKVAIMPKSSCLRKWQWVTNSPV